MKDDTLTKIVMRRLDEISPFHSNTDVDKEFCYVLYDKFDVNADEQILDAVRDAMRNEKFRYVQ